MRSSNLNVLATLIAEAGCWLLAVVRHSSCASKVKALEEIGVEVKVDMTSIDELTKA